MINHNGLIRQLIQKPLDHQQIRAIYNQVIEHYEMIQQEISVIQKPYLEGLDIKNESAKIIVPNLEKELNSHLFSVMNPTDQQLWRMKQGLISTEQLPQINDVNAIKASALMLAKPEEFSEQYNRLADEFRLSQIIDSKKQETSNDNASKLKFSFSSITFSNEKHSEPPDLQNLKIEASTMILNASSVLNHEDKSIFCFLGATALGIANSVESFGKQNPEIMAGLILTGGAAAAIGALGHTSAVAAAINKITSILTKVIKLNPLSGIGPNEVSLLSNHMLNSSVDFLTSDNASLFRLLTEPNKNSELSKLIFHGFLELTDSSKRLVDILNYISPDTLNVKDKKTVMKTILENSARLVLLISMIYGLSISEKFDRSELSHALSIPADILNESVENGKELENLQSMAKFLKTITSGFSNIPLNILEVADPRRYTLESLETDNDTKKAEKDALTYMHKLLVFSKISPLNFQKWIAENPINSKLMDNFRNVCDKNPQIKAHYENEPFFQQLNQAYELEFPQKQKTFTDKIVNFFTSNASNDSSIFSLNTIYSAFKKTLAPILALPFLLIGGLFTSIYDLGKGIITGSKDASSLFNYTNRLLESEIGINGIKPILLVISSIKTVFKLFKTAVNSFAQSAQKLLSIGINLLFHIGVFGYGVITGNTNLIATEAKLLANMVFAALASPFVEIGGFLNGIICSAKKFYYWATGQDEKFIKEPRFYEGRKEFIENSFLSSVKLNISSLEVDLAKQENVQNAIAFKDKVFLSGMNKLTSMIGKMFSTILDKVDNFFYWSIRGLLQSKEYQQKIEINIDRNVSELEKLLNKQAYNLQPKQTDQKISYYSPKPSNNNVEDQPKKEKPSQQKQQKKGSPMKQQLSELKSKDGELSDNPHQNIEQDSRFKIT